MDGKRLHPVLELSLLPLVSTCMFMCVCVCVCVLCSVDIAFSSLWTDKMDRWVSADGDKFALPIADCLHACNIYTYMLYVRTYKCIAYT